MVVDVIARMLTVTLWLGLSANALACGESKDAAGPDNAVTVTGAAPRVKPATTPATGDPEELVTEPGTEAAELPRGVSAPPVVEGDTVVKDAPKPEQVAAKSAAPKPEQVAAKSAAPKPEEGIAKPTLPGKKPEEVAAKPAAPSKPAAATTKTSTPKQAAPPPAIEVPPVKAEPTAAPPPPPAKASVVVPHTDHVRVEVPSGLQHWLDEDDRMKPWLGKAVNVADSCYSKVRADNPSASGVIAVKVSMHENARPSGGVSSISGDIKSIVMCATTKLLGIKMPLFTGNEGETYTVRIRFDP
jgi:hypothetical protein